jgi:two-component system nitrogen regulation sensor histidine kinase NtrY
MKFKSTRIKRKLQNWMPFLVVGFGPLLAIATYLAFGPLNLNSPIRQLRLVLFVDLAYVFVVVVLLYRRIRKLVLRKGSKINGSLLHLRLTRVFSLIAFVPTVLVAVFAVITLNFGLEGWFSERVRAALGSSLIAAETYEAEKEQNLLNDTKILAMFLNSKGTIFNISKDSDLRSILTEGQSKIQRGLKEAFVIDGGGVIKARGFKSYLFDFEALSSESLLLATNGEAMIIKDWDNNEFRAVLKLKNFLDRYLYVSRVVDGNILGLLDETKVTVGLYRQLEDDRGKLLFNFALLYLGFAVILILASIWFGFWFAERLSRPIVSLADASQEVGLGNLETKVDESPDDDEISLLGRSFNNMTKQLKFQRDQLILTSEQTERRTRLFDSVLSSVSTGVIGVDPKGNITFINKSALDLLRVKETEALKQNVKVLIPEFLTLFNLAQKTLSGDTAEAIKISRQRKVENLLVRIGTRVSEKGLLEGFVVVFDDVTELVSAQKLAAWGDVARRIAHEIKNPLTPIRLSAERLFKKLSPLVGGEVNDLKQYTDVIIRQTSDIQRIVDDFSKFARMPELVIKAGNLSETLKSACLLQRSAYADIDIVLDIDGNIPPAYMDQTMISQVCINLIKNAAEGISSMKKSSLLKDDLFKGKIKVALFMDKGFFNISIKDNGIGFPADRSDLFEPYVTSRKEGTGLGLSIVKKIIDEHQGNISLLDSIPFENELHSGAEVVVLLPHSS